MGHITQQERRGLEELFVCIDHSRYDSKIALLKIFITTKTHKLKIFLFKSLRKSI